MVATPPKHDMGFAVRETGLRVVCGLGKLPREAEVEEEFIAVVVRLWGGVTSPLARECLSAVRAGKTYAKWLTALCWVPPDPARQLDSAVIFLVWLSFASSYICSCSFSYR